MTYPEVTVHQGDCLETLRQLPSESVHCCVTSPPYYSLRDYGTGRWEGGSAECDHVEQVQNLNVGFNERWGNSPGEKKQEKTRATQYRDTCGKCGARRVDQQIGLEASVEEHIAKLVEVFREVRTVLRRDGTVWLNYGDAYACAPNGNSAASYRGKDDRTFRDKPSNTVGNGFKPKDLMMLPHRLAIALQVPYTVPHKIKLERDRAWLAAFMDGEGCISIRQQAEKNNKGEPCQDGFVPFLCATNNDRELLDHCANITGCGRVGLKDRPDVDARGIKSRRDSYGWRVESLACIDILIDIYPFLIAKRKQAVLAYNLALSNQRGRELRGKGPLPQAEQEKRAYLKELVNKCNQREPVDIPSWCEEPKQKVEPGWWLRSDIVWSKPNPMPESVTDRPTRSHEYIFLLTKSERYYYDAEAIREPHRTADDPRNRNGFAPKRGEYQTGRPDGMTGPSGATTWPEAGRNKRTVWEIPTESYSAAHFATFPRALVRPCILAGTSAEGCCHACGAPFVRLVEKGERVATCERGNHDYDLKKRGDRVRASGMAATGVMPGRAYENKTTGWAQSCPCWPCDPVPCQVLDCFAGSGTVGEVALSLGRSAVLLELNEEYCKLIEKRLSRAQVPLALGI